MNEVLATLSSELSDLPDVAEWTRVTFRLLVAALLGGLIGLEREFKDRPAGLRTHMLVALGAAVFVLVPSRAGFDAEQLSRILQGLVAGIGFLGAGAIMKRDDGREPQGLTTAASIWLTAAIGVAAGMGREATALLVTIFALVILALLAPVEKRINRPRPGG